MERHSLALVDADIIVYRALEKNMVWFGDDATVNLPRAKEDFENTFFDWILPLKADREVLCLSHEFNFRKVLNPTYKASRLKDKPDGYYELRTWIKQAFRPVVLENLEADDAIGIMLTSTPRAVAVSIDKDMLTLPGIHYNPVKNVLKSQTEAEADLYWLRQSLSGDPVDGYKGIPGIGPKKAAGILHTEAPVEVLWTVYLEAYEKAGLTPEDAVMQARMARILRKTDYDQGQVRWTAPVPVERGELPPEYRRNVSKGRNAPAGRHCSPDDGSGSGRREDHA